MTPLDPSRPFPRVFALFWGAFLAAAGYGATFLLTRHFIAFGGTEVDTGAVLAAAVIGTFFGVPLTGTYAGRIGAARCAALGIGLNAVAFTLIALSDRASTVALVGGFALGCGWGTFYLAAPMSLSRLVNDEVRGYWFLRFGAFQMAGIGVSPVLGEVMVTQLSIGTTAFFFMVSAGCCLAALLLFAFDMRTRDIASVISGPNASWLSAVFGVLRSPARTPILMVGLGAAAFGGILTFQSSIVEGTSLTPGTYFAVYTCVVVGARWLLAGSISRISPAISIPMLLAVMILGICLLFATAFEPVAFAAHASSAALFGVGYGLVYPLIQARAANDVGDPGLQDAALTWFVIFYFGGLFGFPFLGGWIIVWLGAGALITATVFIGLLEFALGLGIRSHLKGGKTRYRSAVRTG